MTECNCEFCMKCPDCGHRADEHMCGDFAAHICYKCESQGEKCGVSPLEEFANLNQGEVTN